jgi:hypothetical protein
VVGGKGCRMGEGTKEDLMRYYDGGKRFKRFFDGRYVRLFPIIIEFLTSSVEEDIQRSLKCSQGVTAWERSTGNSGKVSNAGAAFERRAIPHYHEA